MSGAGPNLEEPGATRRRRVRANGGFAVKDQDIIDFEKLTLREADRPRPVPQFRRKLVRFALQQGRIVEGNVHVTEGQSLTTFLAPRNFVSLTEARWVVPEGGVMPHLAVRSDQILWSTSLDEDFPVSTMQPPVARPRWAELTMADGVVLNVGLYIAEEQRLTDYVESAPGYLPVLQGSVVGQNRLLGPVAVNRSAILTVREIDVRP
jgi:hypothetical protein